MKIPFALKLGALMVIMVTALAGGLLVYFYQYSYNMMLQDLRQSISDVTRTGAFVFKEEDREMVAELRQQLYKELPQDYSKTAKAFSTKAEGETQLLISPESAKSLEQSIEFQYVVQLLRRIQEGSRERFQVLSVLDQTNIKDKNASRIAWAYLLVKVPGLTASEAQIFLADSNYQADNFSEAGNPIGNMYKPGAFFVTPFSGQMGIAQDWYTDEFSTVMSAAVPIKDDQGKIIAILGVDYDVASFQNRIHQQKVLSWQLFAIAVLIAIAITVVIAFWVSVPLGKLRNAAEQLSQHDFKHRVSIKSNDEFGLLAKTMNQVCETLGQFTDNLEQVLAKRNQQLADANGKVKKLHDLLSQENAHLSADVDNLMALRTKALPYLNSSLNKGPIEVGFYYLASRAVCGDFWQVNHLPDSTQIYFGQVSGYGLEAASLTLQVQALLQKSPVNAEETLQRVNHFLCEQTNRFNVPAIAKVLCLEFKQDQWSIGGHYTNPIILKDKEVQEIEIGVSNKPLGIDGSWHLSLIDFDLEEGKTMLMMSPGFVFAVKKLAGQEDKDISLDQFNQLLGKELHCIDTVMDKITQAEWFEEFKDDISAIQIKHSQ
jgi:phosphoserine phosphatase RsbU/P